MMKIAVRTAPALLLLVTSWLHADELPSNTVRIGVYGVYYHVNGSDVSGPYVPAGVNLDLHDLATPYFAYLRRLSPHFTAELAAGWPPETKTFGSGPAYLGSVPYAHAHQTITTARWLAPTALLEYVFFDESVALRPYIGVGINYVNFYDRRQTAAGNAASGGPTRIELPSSWGPAGTVGVSYRLPKNFSVMASYSIARVCTRLTAITDGLVRTSDINFGPQTFVVAAGYSF